MAHSVSSRMATAARDTDFADDSELLIGLHATVSQDGDIASFFVTHEGRIPFKVSVPFTTMALLSHEVRYASQLMTYRQRMKLDRGSKAIQELCATALRPVSVEFVLEPGSGDRLVIFQFAENSPLVLRMTASDITVALTKLAAINDRSVN